MYKWSDEELRAVGWREGKSGDVDNIIDIIVLDKDWGIKIGAFGTALVWKGKWSLTFTADSTIGMLSWWTEGSQRRDVIFSDDEGEMSNKEYIVYMTMKRAWFELGLNHNDH